MFKKVIGILLSFLVLSTNTGWALALHFCEEDLASITFEYIADYQEVTSDCEAQKSCCVSDNEHKKCCDSKQIEVKSSQDKFISKIIELNLFSFVLTRIDLAFVQNVISSKSKRCVIGFYTDVNAPPLYKLYCQLVFYA